MMPFAGFTEADFNALAIPTLEGRMHAIQEGPRPKLEALGTMLAPELTGLVGRPFFPMVAKHARRKVNPPDDTWVAWSENPRGYKMLPHFQVGLWQTHAFIQAGVIYEAEARAVFARNLLARLDEVRRLIPPDFRWLEDYTRPEGIPHQEMTPDDFHRIADRLEHRKQADCMVGLSLDRAAVTAAGPAFATRALSVMQTLLPVYRLAFDPDAR